MVNILGVGHYVLALICGLLTALSRCARGGGGRGLPHPGSDRPGAVAVIRH
ncbi:hypothetical protein PR003_g11247 [Phytophthora rubi]|uniref:RxLR effector protein n=1 Tax=Phytophthora rubi TaxID=129364 RepID=A0A6A3LVM6_9STRA|nr:hypothetical protein PR002_g12065 [Phytophthora rubi]KAE9031825.1 hypothetical protein PR001_g10898 [Phytophthora rubi]KAE9338984.1 hypothetical protein PR003_g11247 [Phytophthora rubi]